MKEGGRVRSFGHAHDLCQAEKAENTDPRTNYAVNYATARGHLIVDDGNRKRLRIPHLKYGLD